MGRRRSAGPPGSGRSHKTVIGRRLRARTPPAQKTEARVACAVLNRMAELGMPASQRAAREAAMAAVPRPSSDLRTKAYAAPTQWIVRLRGQTPVITGTTGAVARCAARPAPRRGRV